jgi:hypothetical protein
VAFLYAYALGAIAANGTARGSARGFPGASRAVKPGGAIKEAVTGRAIMRRDNAATGCSAKSGSDKK